MRYFKNIVSVELSESELNKAKEFAHSVSPTTSYSDSKQSNTKKIEDDHFISKLGEEAVCKVFSNYTKKVKMPDYTIYEAEKKSWTPDIEIDGIGLGVKTMKKSSAEKFGLSWTFQSIQGGRTDPILSDSDAWICFVEYDDSSGNTCNVYPPYQIKELTFKDPKLSKLVDKKKVVYAEDLPKID